VVIRSLALTTELALAALRGRVTDRGDYLVVETPDNPGYYDGNVLVLPAPPQVGEVTYWTRRFTDELGKNPAIKHVSLWWDGTNGDEGAAAELRAAGFSLQSNQVMVLERGARASDQRATYGTAATLLPVRELAPDEVLATADVAYTIGDRHDDTYRLFLDRRAAWHRDLVTSGRATFWGALDGDALVASLGLVWLDDKHVARYQDVQTLPTHRKRGLASALLDASTQAAFARGIERVVIITEPDGAGARIYARHGFRTVERTVNARRV
jgi:ribosomal protein S18 acetylase RimI-like enzyme